MPTNLLEATRQNHALEHATIAVLLGRLGPGLRAAGRAAPNGFHIYGDIPSPMVEEAAKEALHRLRHGEASLAVSPFCGTNYVTAGILAGIATTLALGNGPRLKRLPWAILASVWAVLVGWPLGRLAQKHLTTSPDLSQVSIEKISRQGEGRFLRHWVQTSRSEAVKT